MKIIQIMPEFDVAGAEIMCENLIYQLQKKGHNVIAVSLYNFHSDITERMEKAGIEIRYLNKKRGFDFSMIVKLIKIFKAEKPDVIHTHRYIMLYAIPAAIFGGIKKRIHTLHSIATKENTKFLRKINKLFFKKFGVIPVALSEMIKNTIIDEYKIPADKVPVDYNGIDLSKCIVKNTYVINKNFKIIHIGRFQDVKNHSGLIDAFKLFHDKHNDSELILIGDGERKQIIEDYVKKIGLIECVKFLGRQPEVFNFLHNADVFTLTSFYEGIPMTLIEAMGTGLPIVATAVGGIPDMLDERSALLVPVVTREIALAFEKYYTNLNLRKQHGEAALELSKKFSASYMADGYIKIYSSVRK